MGPDGTKRMPNDNDARNKRESSAAEGRPGGPRTYVPNTQQGLTRRFPANTRERAADRIRPAGLDYEIEHDGWRMTAMFGDGK